MVIVLPTVSFKQSLRKCWTSCGRLARSAMSPRTFARRFLASTGTTPYQWLVRQRVQFAQRLLEMSDLPTDSVAEKSGFSTAANLQKHFSRAVHTSPQAYRHTFKDWHAS